MLTILASPKSEVALVDIDLNLAVFFFFSVNGGQISKRVPENYLFLSEIKGQGLEKRAVRLNTQLNFFCPIFLQGAFIRYVVLLYTTRRVHALYTKQLALSK